MSKEWKRSTWAFSPVALGHNAQRLLNAIHTAMLDTGWVLASWSNGGALGADNYYLRSDRFRIDVNSTIWGAGGNQTIAIVGANLTKGDLIGGGATAAGSTKATGYVGLTAQPIDGNTVTLTDGVLTKVFEFDDNGAVVGSNIPVPIGTSVENSLENLANTITSSCNTLGVKLSATPHWNWWYTGDNFYQHGGIRTRTISTTGLEICSFLENIPRNASQYNLAPPDVVDVTLDLSQVNSFLFVLGEDGLYIEGGTGANYNNIAHGAVFAYNPDPTLQGTRDRERTWCTQGITFNLRGALTAYAHTQRFVETVSDRRNHTGSLYGRTPRGSNSVLNRSIVNNRDIRVGNRDHMMCTAYNIQAPGWDTFTCTLGLMQSNFDDLYRISGLMAIQGAADIYVAYRNSGGVETVAPPDGQGYFIEFFDSRNALREITKFGCCSSYVLPWNTVTDKRTGAVFRVAQVVDTGRNSNLAIMWPDNSNVTTIPVTP